MISVSEADRLLKGLLPPPSTEAVPLERAVGRVLAQPLAADRDGPPYDRVAMDGYAVETSEARRSWHIQGLQCAGQPPLRRAGQGTAVEVATGAVMPLGCDAVVPYEDTERTGDVVSLRVGLSLPVPSRHVHRKGSDYRTGDLLLTGGIRLLSPHLHSLASAGVDPVTVVRRARWSLAATGDELVEVRATPQPWQIRRSNAAAIAGEAGAWGLEPREQVVLADDRDQIRRGLERILPGLDALVLTGGVSAGVLDLIPGVLKELGAEVLFHKLAQRPGKPLWCGRISSASGSVTVFGLPGNPVSSLFSFRRYVLPWLLAFEGRPPGEHRVRLGKELRPPEEGQTLFLPWSDTAGVLDWKGSGDFSALAQSSGFIEVNDARSLNEPRCYPWGGFR